MAHLKVGYNRPVVYLFQILDVILERSLLGEPTIHVFGGGRTQRRTSEMEAGFGVGYVASGHLVLET